MSSSKEIHKEKESGIKVVFRSGIFKVFLFIAFTLLLSWPYFSFLRVAELHVSFTYYTVMFLLLITTLFFLSWSVKDEDK